MSWNNFSDYAISLLNHNAYQKALIDVTLKNGTTLQLENKDIMIGSFSIDRYTTNTNNISLGCVSAAEFNVKLNNHDGRFTRIDFGGAQMTVSISIVDDTSQTGYTEYFPCGIFTVYNQTQAQKTINITALDRMTLFDRPFDSGVFTSLPISIIDAIMDLIRYCGVAANFTRAQLEDDTVNWDSDINYIPDSTDVLTCRQMLSWIGGCIGVNFYIDANGLLNYGWYSDESDTDDYYWVTSNKTYSHDFNENGVYYTGLYYRLPDGSSVLYGNPEKAMDLSANPLILALSIQPDASNVRAILAALEGRVISNGGEIFSAVVKPAPYLFPMDLVLYVRDNGDDTETSFYFALTHTHYTLNGTTFIERVGQTEQEYQEVPTSSTGTAQIQRVNGDLMVYGNATFSGTVTITGVSALLKAEAVTVVSGLNVGAREYQSGSTDLPAQAGWTPLGIVGFSFTQSSWASPSRLTLNQNKIEYGIRNLYTSAITVTLTAQVLYIRTNL